MITHMFLTLCIAFFVAVPLACEWDVRTSDVLFRKYGFIETNSIIAFLTRSQRPSAWSMRWANQVQITPFVIFGLIRLEAKMSRAKAYIVKCRDCGDRRPVEASMPPVICQVCESTDVTVIRENKEQE